MLPVILVENPQYGKLLTLAKISLFSTDDLWSMNSRNVYLQQPRRTECKASTGDDLYILTMLITCTTV